MAILDLICLLVILAGVGLGYAKGLFKMVARLASVILALIIAGSVAGKAAEAVFDKVVSPGLESIVANKIEETGAEETVSKLYDMVDKIQKGLENSEALDSLQSGASEMLDNAGIDLDKAYGELNSFLSGLSPTITNFIADKIDLEQFSQIKEDIQNMVPSGSGESSSGASESSSGTGESSSGASESSSGTESDSDATSGTSPDSAGTIPGATHLPVTSNKVAKDLVGLLRTPIVGFITPIGFALIFIILNFIIYLLLRFLVSLLEKIKITEKASHIAGACIGAICAFALAIVIALVCKILVSPTSDLYGLIDNSLFIQFATGLFPQKIAPV